MKKILSVLIIAVILVGMIPALSLTVDAAHNYLFPVKNGRISYYYGYTESYGGWHSGIDIISNGDDYIYAAESGIVSKASDPCWHVNDAGTCNETNYPSHYNNYGNCVKIEQDDGNTAIYGHLLQGSLLVKEGDRVTKGEPVAKMGASGYAFGKHLHFEVRNNGSHVNVNPIENGGSISYMYTSHKTHNYNTYVYYWAAHPHYKCYACSCGEVKENKSEPMYVSSCEQCNSQYTIKYNANGGSGTMSSHKSENGSFTLTKNKFTKTGYTFVGWNAHRASDNKWFALGGNNWYTDAQIKSNGYTKKIYEDNSTHKLSSGWIGGSNNDTLTFYAVWESNTLKVQYNANGGSINSDTYKLSGNLIYKKSDNTKYAQNWTYNKAKSDGLINASTFGISRTGYTFKGWSTDTSGKTIFSSTDSTLLPSNITSTIKTKSCTVTLYAIWEPNKLSVQYNANGGSIDSDTYKLSGNLVYKKSDNTKYAQSWTYNKAKSDGLINASTFGISRAGYTFKGWSTDTSGKTIFSSTDSTLLPTNITSTIKSKSCTVTLYAIWEKHDHVFKNYVYNNDATYAADGTKTGTCSCGKKDTVTATDTRQPRSATVSNGETIRIVLNTTGNEQSYQWYFKDLNSNKFYLTNSYKSNVYEIEMTSKCAGRQVYCIVTDKNGNSIKSNVATLDMKGRVKITTQPTSATATKGENVYVRLNATGDGLTYKWYFKNKGSSKFYLTNTYKSNLYELEMSAAQDGRQVYCVVTDKYGNSVKSNVVTLNLKTEAWIFEESWCTTVYEGENIYFKISAEGDGLTYKWYFKNKGSSKFYLTNTYKGNLYELEMSESQNGRQVYCVVTDKYGNIDTSRVVTLNMKKELRITKEPVSTLAVAGERVSIRINAYGDGLTYKWYFSDPGSKKFYLTNSYKSNVYELKMNASCAGRIVYCVVTDKYGYIVQSKSATLNLKTVAKITKQPVNALAQSGTTAKISVTAVGDGLTYKWYHKDKGSSKYILTSIKTKTYSIPMTAARDGRQIYCVVTDKYGNAVKSKVVLLSLKTVAKITKQPVTVTAAKGATAKISVSAVGDGLTYKWYHKDKGSSKFILTSIKTKNYAIPMTAARNGRQVYCVVTDKYGNSVKSKTVTIKLK